MDAVQPKSLLTLKLRDLNDQGQGVAQDPGGRVVFVDGGLPGETLQARIVQEKKAYASAVVESIQSPSEERVQPFCPIAQECGGCQLQHLSHQGQLDWKAKHLVETLRRVGGITSPEPESLHGQDRAYRRTLRLVVAWLRGEARIGFFAPRSHRVVEVLECPVSKPELNEALAWFRAQLNASPASFKGLTALSIRATAKGVHLIVAFEKGLSKAFRAWAKEVELPSLILGLHGCKKPPGNRLFPTDFETMRGATHLEEDRLGFEGLRCSPLAFVQAHQEVHDKFLKALEDFAADLPKGKALDLFCGTGISALMLDRAGHKVVAIEADPGALADCKSNGHRFAKSLRPIQAVVEDWMKKRPGQNPALVFLNPPRKGLAPGGAESLLALGAERIVYQSCHASSLARDAGILVAAGYVPRRLLVLDFFPQTAHLEAVLFLEKGSPESIGE